MSDLEYQEHKTEVSPNDDQDEWEFSICFQVLNSALANDELKDLLMGDMGAFSVRYWFINHCINTIMSSDTESNALLGKKEVFNKGFLHFAKSLLGRMHPDKTDILFISRNRQMEIKTPSGIVIGDYLFHGVISELKKLQPQLMISSLFIDDSYRKYEYASVRDFIKETSRAIKLHILWRQCEKSLRKNSQNCSDIIRFAESFFRFRILLRYGMMGCSIRNYVIKTKPKIVIANDDCIYTHLINTPNHKLVVVQSASILEPVERLRAFTFEDQRLLPEAFVVTGLEYEKIKKKYNAAKRVVVTGQPRYDILYDIHKMYSRTDFLKRIGIKETNKVLLWTTQCHGLSDDENIRNLNAIILTLKQLRDVTLIIKQHPEETEIHTKIIRDNLKKQNVQAVIMEKDSDTYEQICACDILITRHSTTAIEAIALNKPVIILNLSGRPDPIDYVTCGVALGVYEERNLKGTIEKLLQDDSELRRNREKYIKQRLYKIDGKATKRVVDLISQMMDNELYEHDN